MEPVFVFLKCYAYLFVCGIGPYFVLAPRFLRSPRIALPLIPMCGVLLIALVGIYTLYFNLALEQIWYLRPVVLSLVIFAVQVARRPKELRGLWRILRENFNSRSLRYSLPVILVGAIVLWPVLKDGFATSPYRTGIDHVGYVQNAQFLMHGGLLREVNGLWSEASIETRDILQIYRINEVEYFLRALRWGAPFVLASVAKNVGVDQAYQVSFLFLSIPYLFIGILISWFLRRAFQLKSYLSYIAALLIGLNVNLMNIYFEGMWAQIICLPVFTLFLLMGIDRAMKGRQAKRAQAFGLFVISGMISIYNESVLILFAVLFCTMALDFVIRRQINRQAVRFYLLSLLGGLIFSLPYSLSWFGYTVRNIAAARGLGYNQPFWATPSEIFGLGNIYRISSRMKGVDQLAMLSERRPTYFVEAVIISILLSVTIFYFLRKVKKDQLAFWLSPLAFVSVAFATGPISQFTQTNYLYMKFYTLFLPMLWIPLIAGIFYLSRLPKLRYFPALIFFVPAFAVGYIVDFNRSGDVISPSLFETRIAASKLSESNCVLLHRRRGMRHEFTSLNDRIFEETLRPILPFPTIEQDSAKYIKFDQYGDRRVCLFLQKKELQCPACIKDRFKDSVLFENAGYMIVKTNKPLIQLKAVADGSSEVLKMYWLPDSDFLPKGDL